MKIQAYSTYLTVAVCSRLFKVPIRYVSERDRNICQFTLCWTNLDV